MQGPDSTVEPQEIVAACSALGVTLYQEIGPFESMAPRQIMGAALSLCGFIGPAWIILGVSSKAQRVRAVCSMA
jgi:hypothetical protein